MNGNNPRRRGFWSRLAIGVATLAAVGLAVPVGYVAWEYLAWRNKMIEWDQGTIDRLCGGDSEEERLLEIRFVRQWEYKALKRTPDGEQVWIHWKLSKRHCGNWMLVDRSQAALIRPFAVRFPNGAPERRAFSCLGIPIDENAKYQHRDALAEALRQSAAMEQ